MARKSDQGIIELQEAISEIKKIIAQNSGGNKKFSEAQDTALRWLSDELFNEVSQRFGKTKGKSS